MDRSDPDPDPDPDSDGNARYTLCTIWVDNQPKRVRVPFKPFTDLFDLDVHQDVIIIQEDHGVHNSGKTHIKMRTLHLFNEGEDTVPYDQDVFEIQEEGWSGEEGPHNISLTVDGRAMVWCGGVAWIYDWTSGEKLGRIPPIAPTIWKSNLGMAWAGKNIVLGLDMPHHPDDQDQLSTTAYLAAFEVNNTCPGTSSLPLLLELPFSPDLLDDTVRDLLDLPRDTKISLRGQDHLPFLQRNAPFGLILVATEFTINDDNIWRLIIVLPTNELQKFDLKKERGIPPPDVARGNEWDPFAGLEATPYSKWCGHAYTFVEPAHSPDYFHGFYEAQHSLRLYHHNHSFMERHGLLHLTILDFNQKRLRTVASDFKSLGGLGTIGEVETQSLAADRRKPFRYKRAIIKPIKDGLESNLGCAEVVGEFALGQKGEVNVLLFDGERLFLQQRSIGKCWILDFGVREIVGILGEEPRAEEEERLETVSETSMEILKAQAAGGVEEEGHLHSGIGIDVDIPPQVDGDA
ncbi:hypothetical protein I302_106278 [Kwoniella bestiolae CBS 10118]|uniref:Uncharacterized protein n=1 Tax=Kwoniella bestiolae CBS 10118 TaxID=1296100 RepID=A0A1B9G3L7_9TREE|nr:hypothetical protein I302_05402 [Kwoniella bestiolae CBS 10118]OCF25582.1 hypothetical protein I302_05402 [Kwoniella bestiolae CBS 10118]